MGKSEEAEVCQIFKVRGVLHDGAIVAANGIFNSEGKIESEAKHEYAALSMNGELVEPTDELRELAKRLEIISSLKKVDWDKIKTSIMVEIINLIKNNE